jgi:transcriptional regulator with XRE-family HTH domain
MPSKKSASPARGHAPARPPKAAAHEITLRKYLGRALREHRRQHALTISQVAELARISSGMLSKIENGQVAPTLDVIERTGDRTGTALGLTLGPLFQKYTVPDGSARQVKAGQGMEKDRFSQTEA